MKGRKIKNILKWLLGILLILLIALVSLSQLKPVQNTIVQRVIGNLSDRTNTEMKLGSFHWKGLKWLYLENLLVRDQQADTLLALDQLTVEFRPWQLFNRKIALEKVQLTGLLARIKQDQNKRWNYDFLIDAFTSDTTTEVQQSEQEPWDIQANGLELEQVRFDYLDDANEQALRVKWTALQLDIDQMSLNQNQLSLNDLILVGPDVGYIANATVQVVDTVRTTPSTPDFPDLGWDITVQNFELSEGDLAYRIAGRETSLDIFNASDIRLSALNWDIDSIHLSSDLMAANIRSLVLQEQSGLQLRNFQTGLVFSDSLLAFEKFNLNTTYSRLNQSVVIRYPAFNTFVQTINYQESDNTESIQIDLDLDDLSISPRDIRLVLPEVLSPEVEAPLNVSAFINGSLSQLNIETIALQQGSTLSFRSAGTINQVLNRDDQYFDFVIDLQQLEYDRLLNTLEKPKLPEGFRQWGAMALQTRLTGRLNDLLLSNLTFRSAKGPQLLSNIKMTGLPDYKSAVFALTLDSLQTKAEDLTAFSATSLPPALNSLGDLLLIGSYEGTMYNFKTDLQLRSDAGRLNLNSAFDFTEDYADATYNGNLSLNDFQLGKITGDTLLGSAGLSVNIQGEGLQPKDWKTQLEGTISDLDYRGYAYDTLFYEGNLDASVITVNLRMNDPHLSFVAEGQVPVADVSADYGLQVTLDTIDLQPLSLYQTPLGLRTELQVVMENLQLDSLQGQALLTGLSMRDQDHEYQTDSITFASRVGAQGEQALLLNSDLVQLNLAGQYSLQDLPNTLLHFVNQYFPFNPQTADSLFVDSTRLQASIRVGNITPLTQILLPDLKTLDTFDLQFAFDGPNDQWRLNAFLPNLQFAEFQLDSFRLNSEASETRFQNQINAQQVKFGENTFLPNPTITVNLGNDSLQWAVSSFENTQDPLWQLAGNLHAVDSTWRLHFDPDLWLDAGKWRIDPNHEIRYQLAENWQVDRWRLAFSDSSFIQLDGQGDFRDTSSTATLTFQQFGIDVLSPFLDYPPDYLGGTLNGRIALTDLFQKPGFSATLDLQKWSIDSVMIGNLTASARQLAAQKVIEIETQLGGYNNELNIQGQYNVDQQEFAAESAIEKLDLQTIDPFLTGLTHDSRGFLSGQFSAKGNVRQPVLEGSLQFNEVETTIDYVNTPYAVTRGMLTFTEDRIDFNDLRLLDAEGREALLRGGVAHQYFDSITLDLNFSTDRFRFLNTTAEDNELFYGRLILQSDVDIQGPIDSPRFFINAKTQPNTNFYVVPLTDEQAISREDFIIYGQPALDSMGRDTGYLDNYRLTAPGIDLQLNLEMTPDAALEVIIDPLTGDKLVCKGRSNLTVGMAPSGEVNISGNYEITEGSYSFSYEQFIQRSFLILPNSKIIFSGDPLRAQLDITTAYQIRVPLRDLVQSQMSSDTRLTGLRSDVRVLMKITGDLIRPVLDFDIVLVGDPQGATAEAARTRLQQLRSNETELNKQVFGLLLFNSFINEQGSGQSIAQAGESVILSSVSKLLANQLNRLADQYLKGFEFSLGVDAYRPGVDPGEESGVTTDVQLDVSKRLFNDRLNVKVGGNVNVENTSENPSLTAFSGNFVLEYRLTPEGGTLLRAYRRNDYDALNEGNVIRTGVGISIKKTLNNKKRKRKHE